MKMVTFKAGVDTFVRNIMHGNLGGEAEEWSLDEALGCMEAFHVLEALPESGVRCICSSVIAQSSSRMLRAFTPFWPVWFVIRESRSRVDT